MFPKKNEFERAIAVCRRGLLPVAVFSFGVNMLMLTMPLYMMQVFDRVLSARSLDTLVYLSLIACFALVVMGLLDLARARIMVRLGTWLDQRLNFDAFTNAIKASFQARNSHTQPIRDLQEVRNFMTSNTLFQMFDAPWMPIYILIIWTMHPLLGILALSTAIIFLGLALLNEFATKQPLKSAQEHQMKAQADAESIMRNAEVINALGMGGNIARRWMGNYHEMLDQNRSASDRGRLIVAVAKSWRMIVQILVMGLGAYLVLNHELASGGMLAGSILLGRALAPIEGAIDSWKQARSARAAFSRLKTFFAHIEQRPEQTQLPAPKGHIAVRNLVFGYPNAKTPTIRGVSFDINPGEVLAIVGPSGAGKSTLARLITGIYRPLGGSVRLDGSELSAWERERIGPYIGYLPQDVELFEGTVAENVGRLGPTDDAAVIEAARLAGVHELVLGLTDGYDTRIGEAGGQLSGGQRQRVGLARALYGDPPLLVLDEPNANMDEAGEAALHRAIGVMKERGSTVVMIAHRPSMLKQVDRILWLSGGQIRMLGEREEVLKQLTAPRPVPPARPAVAPAAAPQIAHG
ncbi:MAG: type I secretion system permease/ATPase [Geminicoccaceae bacterium]|nr:type I secretion system permease/ATPase [Geminicoccaceae bacterium]